MKEFIKSQHLTKLRSRNLIASDARCTPALSCWKTLLRSDMWWAGTAVRWQHDVVMIAVTDLDSRIDKCQTGVLLSTCDLLTDAFSDWLNVGHVYRRFFVTSFLVAAGWTVKSFCGFFAMVTKYLFVIYQMMLTSVNKYYSGTVSNGRVLLGSSLHLVLDHGDLWTISHSSVVTFGRIRGKNRLVPFSKHDVIVFATGYWQNLGRHMHKLFNTVSRQGSFKLQSSNQPPSKHGSPGCLFIQKLVGSSLWVNALLNANQKKTRMDLILFSSAKATHWLLK